MRSDTGRLGEKKAEEFLRRKGYRILTKNYRTNLGELDLVCLDHETLVFVEVKTNHGDDYGAPEERVHLQKQKQIVKTANHYLKTRCVKNKDCRFDVVSVVIQDDQTEINHIPDAFYIREELNGVL